MRGRGCDIALNAGTIQAAAELDIAQFLKGTQQLQAAVQQINKSLEGIQPATPRLPTEKLSSDVAVGRVALRSLTTELGGIPGLSTSASTGLLSVGTGAVGMAAGVATGAAAITAMVAGMKAATEQAVALEFQLASVKSIKLDLDTSAASASLRQLATETGESAGSLAKGLYQLFSSINVPQEQAILLLQKFSQGAIAAQTDSATFGTAIIGVLNAYKLSVADADHVSDVFFNTVRDGVVTGQQLATGLGPVTASAKQAGVSLEELGALIVGVTKEGGDAAQNLNNLNNLLQKLVTKETTQSFRDLGISVADASGKLHTPIEILGALKVRLQDLTAAQKANALQELFPDLQARQGAQVILSQLDQVRASLVANQTEVGSTKTAYQTMAETNAAALERLKQSVASLAVEFGNQLLPAMGAVLTAAGNLVTGMSDAGRAVDRFLADPKTQAAAALLLKLQQGAGGAAATGEQAAARAAGAAAQTGQTLPIPQVPTEPTAAGQFVQRGLDQLGGAATAAAVEGAAALEKATDGLTASERALAKAEAFLIDQGRERGAQQDRLAENARQVAQDDAELAKAIKERAAAQVAAAQAAADALQLTATAQQRYAAGLAPGIGVQADWNAELVKALDPVKNVGNIAISVLVPGILQAKQATEDSAKAFEIHDLAIAAEVIRLRDLAAKTTDVAQAQALQKQAGDLAAAALDAQARGQAAAAATAAALAKPLTDLAGSIFPALTAQQVAHVQAVAALQGPYEALAAAAQAAGIDIGQFGDLTQLTGQQLADVKKEVDAAAKGVQGFLTEEDRSRFGSVLGTLASSTDAATAAQAKMLEAAGQADEALTLLLQHAGVSPGPLGELKQALLDGGAAAVEAREKIAALTAFARSSSGTIQLKVEVDIAAAQKGIADLQQAHQQASRQRAQDQTEATQQEARNDKAFVEQRADIINTLNESFRQIAAARTQSASQFGSDLAAITSAENKALASVGVEERAAQTAFTQSLSDAQVQHDLAFATATKTYTDGLKAVQDQTAQAIEQVAKAQAAGLQQLSAAMTTFNQQQTQNAFTASVALQNAQNAANGFTDTQSVASAIRSAQIQAEGAAGLAQQNQANALAQSQHSIAQQQVDAQKALTQATIDAAKQMAKLSDDLRDAQATATVAQSNARISAQDTFGRSQVGADFFNAATVRGQRVVLINGVPHIVTDPTRSAKPPGQLQEDFVAQLAGIGVNIGGTQGTRTGTEAAVRQQGDAAESRFDARTAQLNKQEDAAQARAEKQIAKLEEQRQLQQEAFQKAEKARREAQRKADEDFQRQLHTLRVQEATLEELKRITQNLGRPNVTTVTAVQETGKDLLTKAAQAAQQRLRL